MHSLLMVQLGTALPCSSQTHYLFISLSPAHNSYLNTCPVYLLAQNCSADDVMLSELLSRISEPHYTSEVKACLVVLAVVIVVADVVVVVFVAATADVAHFVAVVAAAIVTAIVVSVIIVIIFILIFLL